MSSEADSLISELQLTEHPEGGYYREYYRSDESFDANALPERYRSQRAYGTAIYFLLKAGQTSKFHRLSSDELWFFHSGDSVTVHLLSSASGCSILELGSENNFAGLIPRNTYFAAEVNGSNYSLVSCVVVPGFEFSDFELVKKSDMISMFPDHKALIARFSS